MKSYPFNEMESRDFGSLTTAAPAVFDDGHVFIQQKVAPPYEGQNLIGPGMDEAICSESRGKGNRFLTNEPGL